MDFFRPSEAGSIAEKLFRSEARYGEGQDALVSEHEEHFLKLGGISAADDLLEQFRDHFMKEVISRLRQFRDERDWKQFHNPKDLALALSIESGELLEAFLWKKSEDADVESVKEELADVFAFGLLLADAYGFDIEQIVMEKIASNEKKYPVEKAKGTASKYTEL